MKGFGLSDVGKKRLVNQDSFYGKELSDDCFYAVVCDGMGGAAGGEWPAPLPRMCIVRNWKSG